MSLRHKIIPFFGIRLHHFLECCSDFRRQGIAHFFICQFLQLHGFRFRSRFHASIVSPLCIGIGAAGPEDTKIFAAQTESIADLTHFRNAECRAVFHLEKSGHIGKIAVGKMGIVIGIFLTESADFHGFASHYFHHAGNGMSGIAEWMIFQAAVKIFLHDRCAFLTGFSRGTAFYDFPQRTGYPIHIMCIFCGGINEITEKILRRHAFAEHGLRTVDRCFAKHIFFPGTPDCFDDLSAPIQHFIVIGDALNRHCAVHIFPVFHSFDALWCMEPGLSDHDQRIAIGSAHFIQTLCYAFGIDFRFDPGIVPHPADAFFFQITQSDGIHQRMVCKKGCECSAERAETDKTEFDTHFDFSLTIFRLFCRGFLPPACDTVRFLRR